MHELGAVMANEWMKLVRRKRFLIVAILSLALVCLFGFVEHQQQLNQTRYNTYTQQTTQIQSMQQQIQQLKHSSDPSASAQITQLQQAIQSIAAGLTQQSELRSAKWPDAVNQMIASQEQNIESIQASSTTSQTQKLENEQQVSSIQGQIDQLQYNLSHKIAPLTSDHTNVFTETMNFFATAGMIFVPLLIVVLVADMVSGESASGTIKLLLIRPVSRAKILFGKWLVGTIAATIWTIVLSVVFLVTDMIVRGPYGALQPTTVGLKYTFYTVQNALGGPSNKIGIPDYTHASMIPAWQFYLYGVLLLVISMIVVATITFFLSTLFKSTMASTSSAIGVIVLGYVLTEMVHTEHWIRYIFSTNLYLAYWWSGNWEQLYNQNISLSNGIIVLCVWGIVTLCASFIIFRRRDVLNA